MHLQMMHRYSDGFVFSNQIRELLSNNPRREEMVLIDDMNVGVGMNHKTSAVDKFGEGI